MEVLNEAKKARKRPLANVVAIWEREDGIYPDVIRVNMEGGQVVTYRIDVTMPHPCVVKNREIMDRWAEQDGGTTVIGYKAKHADKKKTPPELAFRSGVNPGD